MPPHLHGLETASHQARHSTYAGCPRCRDWARRQRMGTPLGSTCLLGLAVPASANRPDLAPGCLRPSLTRRGPLLNLGWHQVRPQRARLGRVTQGWRVHSEWTPLIHRLLRRISCASSMWLARPRPPPIAAAEEPQIGTRTIRNGQQLLETQIAGRVRCLFRPRAKLVGYRRVRRFSQSG